MLRQAKKEMEGKPATGAKVESAAIRDINIAVRERTVAKELTGKPGQTVRMVHRQVFPEISGFIPLTEYE